MINTYTSYLLYTRDIAKSLSRVENQPVVQRDTEYYLQNIKKVRSIEEFVDDYRLFSYAMKAHGLEDMTYAKAFMIRALEEGVTDPDSFANRLSDKRYAEFVRSFNFAAMGEDATVYVRANHEVAERYLVRATPEDGEPAPEFVAETEYYQANIGTIKSVDQFLDEDNERLLLYALQAFGLEASLGDRALIEEMLLGGTDDPDSPANQHDNANWKKFVDTFDFVGLGDDTTTYNSAQQPTVDKYLRQTMEEDAGEQNEGVRLALYFQRKAATITNAYQILGDPALAEVVRTLLRLPPEIAQADIDRQAAMIEDRIDLEDLQDPEKVSELLSRFTALWEVDNPSSPAQTSLVSLFQPVEYGISQDTLLAIQSMRR